MCPCGSRQGFPTDPSPRQVRNRVAPHTKSVPFESGLGIPQKFIVDKPHLDVYIIRDMRHIHIPLLLALLAMASQAHPGTPEFIELIVPTPVIEWRVTNLTEGDGLILALKGTLTTVSGTISPDANARVVVEDSSEITFQLDKDGNLEVKDHVASP